MRKSGREAACGLGASDVGVSTIHVAVLIGNRVVSHFANTKTDSRLRSYPSLLDLQTRTLSLAHACTPKTNLEITRPRLPFPDLSMFELHKP